MLTIFPRHADACTLSYTKTHGEAPGRDYRKCKCALHVEGTLAGKMIRKALKTSNWTVAQARVRDAEATGRWETEAESTAPTLPSLAQMVALFIASTHSKGSTLRRITATLLGYDTAALARRTTKAATRGAQVTHNLGLVEMAEAKGYTTLAQITLPDLTALTTAWVCKPEQRNKRIGAVRRFFKYAISAKWGAQGWTKDENPSSGLSYDRSGKNAAPQIPFDGAHLPQDGPELSAVWAYTSSYPKLDALVKLMRYAGLRISDAATFNTSRVAADGSIFLYTAKTGEPVTIPMHPAITSALSQLTPNAQGYYFASGGAKLSTYTDNWRVRVNRMFTAAGVQGGHAHRFRHTFAVDLLLRGTSITTVQAAMAHTSIKTTQRYLAFVAARRKQIGDELRTAWGLTAPAPAPAPLSPVAVMPTPTPIRQGVAA